MRIAYMSHSRVNYRSVKTVSVRQDVELLRILSAIGIVFYHAGVGDSQITYSGLIVFLILLLYFGGSKNRTVLESFKSRSQRLLIPWLVWFLIYSIINIITARPAISESNGKIEAVLAGPSIHLWYLPFAFFCLLATDTIGNYINGRWLSLGGAIAAGMILFATPLWRPLSLHFPYPYPQYAHAIASVGIGIFLAQLKSIRADLSSAAFLFILSGALAAMPYKGVGEPYVIGVTAGWIIAVGFLEGAIKLNLQAISRYMFGIYLVRVLFLRILNKIHLVSGISIAILTFIMSFVFVASLHHYFPRSSKYWI